MRTSPFPPEVRESVITLAETGVSQRDIAGRFGLSKTTVSKWIIAARRKGRAVPVPTDRTGVTVLSGDSKSLIRLRAEAERRHVSPEMLGSVLLATICADDLFNAVLEDAW